MSLKMEEMDALKRIEEIIDALEVRGVTSSKFSGLCSELQTILETLPFKLTSISLEDNKTKDHIGVIINRLRKLETFATAQSEITSGLQKYIADPDK
ncbi:hypothetical protein N8500_07605 [Candidatus Puniceispirillum sp.]|nr:hypothetical protein [Candidatus Puniceispirillum sp.]